MLDQLYADAKKNLNTDCVVGKWSRTLSDADLTAYKTSLGDLDFTSKALFELYTSAGAQFSLTSLKAHRNGECTCL